MSGWEIVYQKSAAPMAKSTEHRVVMKNPQPTVRLPSKDIINIKITESGIAQIS